MINTPDDRLLSVRDAADICAISERAMWNLLGSPSGPRVTRLGRRTLIRRSALNEFLDRAQEGLVAVSAG